MPARIYFFGCCQEYKTLSREILTAVLGLFEAPDTYGYLFEKTKEGIIMPKTTQVKFTNKPRLQKITNLSDDGQSENTYHQIIVNGEVFPFPAIKEQLNSLLSNSDDSNQIATAVCMYGNELMARIKYGEKGLADELARVIARMNELKAVQS